jgi:Enoyl-CoA hydratase/isomerase
MMLAASTRATTSSAASRMAARRLLAGRAAVAASSCSSPSSLMDCSSQQSLSTKTTTTTTTTTTKVTIRFQSTAAAVAAAAAPEKTAKTTTASSKPAPKAKAKVPFVSTPERKYEYFQNVEINKDGVAVIRFDCPGKPVNTISFALADEAKILWKNEVESNNGVKAVVFASAKPDMFIAGADIFDIQQLDDKKELIHVIAGGLEFFQHMRKKGVPLVAAMDGPALGGGLEWALWCDYRVCTDNPKTKVSKR